MEITNAMTNESVNVGAEAEPSTGTAGGVTGEDLFAQYESGASIEDLNGLLAREPAQPEEQQEEAEPSAVEEPVQEPEPQQERLFTQAEMNRIIGQRIREPQDKYSALLDDLEVVMGVDRSQAAEAVRQSRLEVEAQKQGVEDVELYAQKKQLEQQRDAMQQQQYYDQLANDMDRQRRAAGIDDTTYDAMLDNPQFIATARSLYDNPVTRENALQTAYNALYFDDILKQRVKDEKEKIVSNIKAGQERVSEGAMQKSANASAKIDVSKLTDAQLEEYAERARSGEKITF
ncbi:MAG: hypothetical protein HFI90_07045 [Clostridia bacterium]|nr:hypothetical protein [Clostridia bacterium]